MSWRPQPLGQPNLPPTPLEQAAADLIGWLSVNSCTQQSVPEVLTFQKAWNGANPTNPLVEDGKYGPLTRGALQSVMNAIGQGTAPQDCFTPHQVPPIPSPTPSPVGPAPTPPVVVVPPAAAPATTVVAPPKPSPSSALPAVLIGAGVATAGFFGYLYWKKNKRRR